jgi:hypothetical protein
VEAMGVEGASRQARRFGTGLEGEEKLSRVGG